MRAIRSNKNSIVGLYGASYGKRRKVAQNLYEAETLDECCIAMDATLWRRLKFNEELPVIAGIYMLLNYV